MPLLKSLKFSFFLLTLVFFLSACSGSKAYYKRGEKLRLAGMEKEATDYYFIAVQRNTNNIDAKIALKTYGQKLSDELYQKFYVAHGLGKHADAVHLYREAEAFDKKVSPFVTLEKPPYYEDYYKESKTIFLNEQYLKSTALVDDGEFEKAKPLLQEIVDIEPTYMDASSLLLYSDLEPRYQKGISEFESKNYIAAYEIFQKITSKSANYKESKYYKQKCLENGRVTLAMLPVASQSNAKVAEVLYTAIENAIISTKDPFLFLIDRKNLDALIAEQKLGMSGALEGGSVAEAGKLLGAKWVINSKLLSYSESVKKPVKSNEIGYIKYTVRKYDKTKGAYYNDVEYTRTTYSKTTGNRMIHCQFAVSVVSSETGQILYSKTFTQSEKDELDYAEYSEAYRDLYPGNEKEIFTSSADKRNLDMLFQEKRRSLVSEEELVGKISSKIGSEVSAELTKLKMLK